MTTQNVAVRRVGAAVVVLSVVLAACNSSTAPAVPAGPVGDVARQVAAVLAPNADIVDQPFEDFLTRLDLAKTYGARATDIADQIRKTRAAVAAARQSSSASRGSRVARVAPAVGTFTVPHFAQAFAGYLDALTKEGGSYDLPSPGYSNQQTGPDSFTTTTLNVTERFSGNGSVATGSVTWSYSTITIETKTGATLVHITDQRTLDGTIDVCPDDGGNAKGSLTVTSKIVEQAKGAGTTTRNSNGTSIFKGSVNGQAALTSVALQNKVEASWQSASGDGGYSSDLSGRFNAGSNGGFLGGLDTSSVNGTVAARGSATAAEVAKAAGWDMALDTFALEAAYQKAQELWRHGRCVIVAVPEWNVETSIEMHEQEKSMRTEDVEVSSDTKFQVTLRHRFKGGALNKPTNADLVSGKEKISPNTLESGGGQLTYKAGDDDDQEAKALLRSTSNRGIGTLVLTFRTGGKLTLSVRGTQELGPTGATLRSSISIGPAEFSKSQRDDKTWEATAPFTGTSVLVPPDPDCPNLTITQSGTLVLTARVEKRGQQSFWVISQGPGGSSRVVGSGCDEEVTQALAVGGGFGAGLFLGNVGDIVIPIDGGTVQLQGSQGTGRSSGTATGTVRKK